MMNSNFFKFLEVYNIHYTSKSIDTDIFEKAKEKSIIKHVFK